MKQGQKKQGQKEKEEKKKKKKPLDDIGAVAEGPFFHFTQHTKHCSLLALCYDAEVSGHGHPPGTTRRWENGVGDPHVRKIKFHVSNDKNTSAASHYPTHTLASPCSSSGLSSVREHACDPVRPFTFVSLGVVQHVTTVLLVDLLKGLPKLQFHV